MPPFPPPRHRLEVLVEDGIGHAQSTSSGKM
jgi:hypothetical protein